MKISFHFLANNTIRHFKDKSDDSSKYWSRINKISLFENYSNLKNFDIATNFSTQRILNYPFDSFHNMSKDNKQFLFDRKSQFDRKSDYNYDCFDEMSDNFTDYLY